MRRQGSIFSAVASFPSTVTLAETRPRSIEPMYRKLSPVSPATSSWVRSRSWRRCLRFFARTCFKSMPRKSWNRNESARNDSSHSLGCPNLEEIRMGGTRQRTPARPWVGPDHYDVAGRLPPRGAGDDLKHSSAEPVQSGSAYFKIAAKTDSASGDYRAPRRATRRADPAGRCSDYISAVRARSHKFDRSRRHVPVPPATSLSPSAML